jgi:hypothetical protein
MWFIVYNTVGWSAYENICHDIQHNVARITDLQHMQQAQWHLNSKLTSAVLLE